MLVTIAKISSLKTMIALPMKTSFLRFYFRYIPVKVFFVLCPFLFFSQNLFSQAIGDFWTQKADMGILFLSERDRAIGMAVNGKGYIGTGQDVNGNPFNTWWEYDPAADSWSQKTDFPLNARCRTVGWSLNGKCYLGTGFDLAPTYYTGWFQYDPSTDVWTQKGNFPNATGSARYGASGFTIGGKGYVTCGYNGSTVFNDLWEYNSANDTWTQKANIGLGRYSGVGFSIGNYGYVGTGYNAGYLKDFWKYNPLTNTWVKISDLPGNGRALSTGFAIGSRGFIVGGSDNVPTTYSELWEYNPYINQWIQRDSIPQKRYGASVFVIGNTAYIGTGNDGSNTLRDLWAYTPANISSLAFQKSYGGTNDDTDTSSVTERIAAGCPTTDGGYIIASSTKSFGSNYDIWLIKTNSTGNVGWTSKFSGTNHEIASSIRQTSDGGYIIAGFSKNNGDDGLIIKTNSSGSPIWTKNFSGFGVQRANYAEEIPGGYIIVGRTNAASTDGAGIIKLNSAGAFLWGKTYNGTSGNFSEAYSVEQTSVGNFLLSGEIRVSAGLLDAYLAVATSAGTINVSSSWGLQTSGNDTRANVRQTPDGGYIMCGSSTSNSGHGGNDVFLIKTTSAGGGTISWSYLYGSTNDDFGKSIIVTPEGDFIVAGYTKSFGAGNNDALLMKIRSDGSQLWTKTFGGNLSDKVNSVSQTADGGYILFGETESFSVGGTDIYIIKTDSLGNSGCNEMAPVLPPKNPQTWVPSSTAPTNTFIISNTSTASSPAAPQISSLCVACTFPIAIGMQNASCFGECDGDAMVTASTGAQPVTYSWSNGATTDFIDSLCAGGYTVTVTDAAGCTAVDSIYISEPSQIAVNLLSLADTICTGDSILIGSSPSGGTAPYYFFWYPPSGLACDTCQFTKASPPSDTIYYLDVYDDNGCFAEDSMTITVGPQVSVSAGADKTICGGQSTTLSATGGNSYTWSPSIGLSCTSCANPIATPTSTVTYTVVGTNTFGCSDAASVTVTVIPSPTVNITPGSSTFCSGGGVTLIANSNGTSYSWSTGATTASIPAFPSSTTTYSVTVSNGTCTSSDTAVITINPRPFPAMTTGNITCNGACDGTSTATPSAGTAPFSYFWSPGGQTTSSATGLCPGVYTAIITDANGCSANGKDTITQPAMLAAAVTPNNAGCICNGSASVVVSGGTAPYFYSWSSGGSSSAVSNLCGGNYSVTVTDNNGCVTIKSFIINQLPPVVVSVSPNATICSGNTTTIGANVSGAANITYFWMPGNLTTDTISVAPTSNTTYTVIASDSVSNCSDTNSVSVSVTQTPLASIIGNTTICSGQTTALSSATTSGVNYVWNTGATTSSITVNPTITTAYSLTVVASGNNSCSDSDSITVTVSSSPVVSVTSVYDTICYGLSSTTLTAGGGTSYTWFPGSLANDTVIVSPDVTTTYTVLVTNSAGCSSVAAYTIVVQGGFGAPDVTPVSVSYCKGDSILPFIASPLPSVIVVWFDTSGTLLDTGVVFYPPQNLPFGTTNYLVVQGLSDACVSYPTVLTITVNPPPMVSAGPDITICPGHTANLQASGGINYLWSPSDYLNDPAVFNPSSNPDSAITYVVLVTDAKGCKNKDTVAVIVATNDTCGIHIYNVITPNGDGDNDVFFIDGINLFPENFVEIFNRWGSSVWHGKNYDNRKVVWRGQNEAGQPLPAGTYYYVIDVKGLGRFTGWVELLR